MKEPLSLRISDASDPKRGEKFESVLKKRAADLPEVIRNLVDAYIESDGVTRFPVVLQEAPTKYGRRK